MAAPNIRRRHVMSILLKSLPLAWQEIATRRTHFVIDGENEPKPDWMRNESKTAARKRGLRSLLVAAFITRLLATRGQQGDDPAHMEFAVNAIARYRQIYTGRIQENGARFMVEQAHGQALKVLEDGFISEIMLALLTENQAFASATDPLMVFDEGMFWNDVLHGLQIACTTPEEATWVRAGIQLVVPNTVELQRAFSVRWQKPQAKDKLAADSKTEVTGNDAAVA